MIAPRTIWRILVLPVYMLVAGAVFAFALLNTAGSILSPLAMLAPWVMVLATALAMVSIAGGVLRWRRRLAAVRRGRAARGTVRDAEWHETQAPHHAGRG